MNPTDFREKSAFIWSLADLIRDTFRRGKYQDVILPFTVLRRLDQVLAPTKDGVLQTYNRFKGDLDNPDQLLRKSAGFAFYNTSNYDFDRLLAEPPQIGRNMATYINGFSPNVVEILDKFDFRNTVAKLDEAGLLFKVVQRFADVDLHPERVDNHTMGSIYEDLLRRFNEALNENPGEHFTPREIVQLMARMLVGHDADDLQTPGVGRMIYDPCAGSGGMLTIAREQIEAINPQAQVWLFGQEVNPETFATCKADFLIKDPTGNDADNIRYGSTLSNDQFKGKAFDYQLCNPPYGKDWKADKEAVEGEHDRGSAGRFGPGLPRINDGQTLFLLHMLHHMRREKDGGGRVAIIMNGSPLFTGDAGSGESEIRRTILENDWLDAIVALPEQVFYNTGIGTYVWLLTNRKEPERKGKVLLIDATRLWTPMRKSLGDKRRYLTQAHIDQIMAAYEAYDAQDSQGAKHGQDGGLKAKLFPTSAFGYRKITVERPLRRRYQVDEAGLERLRATRAFAKLAESKKKKQAEREAEEARGRARQDAILEMLRRHMPSDATTDRGEFDSWLKRAAKGAGVQLDPTLKKAILASLGTHDPEALPVTDRQGQPEPDPDLRDHETVPLAEDVETYFEREVEPYVPDAWINREVTDPKDGQVGKVGYEINFNRYFYEYTPPRPIEEIDRDIKQLESEILDLLKEVTA
ncbi:MAG: class I SAM-dependent DNA methyltransferase [Rhodovibrio sp.]|nr:class I SAM-dependent DNA methyltransferase [Rhodovibrio sp.]